MRKGATAIMQHILSYQLNTLWASLAALYSLRAIPYSRPSATAYLIANSSFPRAPCSHWSLFAMLSPFPFRPPA
ncbi:MAG: hypothetical protein FWD36_02245, partial [Treponema sp.]|nr:hypothetical protein [Treponema sp.]